MVRAVLVGSTPGLFVVVTGSRAVREDNGWAAAGFWGRHRRRFRAKAANSKRICVVHISNEERETPQGVITNTPARSDATDWRVRSPVWSVGPSREQHLL